jgi:hypothetical protein
MNCLHIALALHKVDILLLGPVDPGVVIIVPKVIEDSPIEAGISVSIRITRLDKVAAVGKPDGTYLSKLSSSRMCGVRFSSLT